MNDFRPVENECAERVSLVVAPREVPGARSGSCQPLEAVKVLLPVWGLRYVHQFLEFCLPTLLAPGNLPALARELPCTFVALTRLEDEKTIRNHPAWQRLGQICNVDTSLIDHLITETNHTTTITLAFAREVRKTPAMLRTLFIFLVSDYIMADGALAAVLARIRAGASGVLAGNFQVVAEDAIPMLRRHLDQQGAKITVAPRELLGWTLSHLHPATSANIVNFGLNHNEHINRLFWRVDESTLLGRFYLMHMIAIKPEVSDFVIGSSCDYSFIPEMCPSNNVAVLTDSDEYLVVEMQPREHESKFLRPGPLDPKQLAQSLAEWTTARHRENAAYTVIYHIGDIPHQTTEAIAKADAFIADVQSRLKTLPKPHRNHPYWIGAIAAHRAATGAPLEDVELAAVAAEFSGQPKGSLIARLKRVRMALFGQVPEVRRFHPSWPDFRLPVAAVKQVCSRGGAVLVISDTPQVYAKWLVNIAAKWNSLEKDRLFDLNLLQYRPLIRAFDACLLVLKEGDLKEGDDFLAYVGPLLKPGGQCFVVVFNERIRDLRGFSNSFAYHGGRFSNPALWIANIQYVRSSLLRGALQMWTRELRRAVARRPLLYAPLAVASRGSLSLFGLFGNLAAGRTTAHPRQRAVYSSIFMTLESAATPMQLPPTVLAARARPHSSSATSRDALRQACAAAQPQAIDPQRLEVSLTRYRFVANLLSGRQDVAEVGRANMLGVRLVSAQVRRLFVYDRDPLHLDAIRREVPQPRAMDIQQHDILQDPLPRTHDSIYSLFALDSVPPGHEDTFVRHVRDSLGRDSDLLLIGCSSMDLLKDAAEVAYPRNGATLKALMDRHFNTVLLFSMSGEVIRPGLLDGADYFMALCCARKG